MSNTTNYHYIEENSDIGNLISYGILFGMLHILTGPDHIAAIITISVNKGYQAFFIGVKWGIGHSIGLLIIFGVMLTIDKEILYKTQIVEWIVGFYLILLGFYGFYKTYKTYKYKLLIPTENDIVVKTTFFLKEKILGLITGILHGLAGPGSILGVLPAILIEDKSKSAAYLGTFCGTGIFIMGTFSAIWGEISKKASEKIGIIIIGLSSLVSFIIGILWVSLLASNMIDII